jgi:tetratricopeptide (TPR) repeat protein
MANPEWKTFLLRATLICSAGLWIFAPAFYGGWLMDDDFYLTKNALLHDPDRLWKIWFQPGSLIEYYPIEASLQTMQWQLWHNETLGYHLTNLVLHLLGAFLVWRLLSKFGLRFAWLGGLFFVIHPAVVESVAWISEFKNVLSLPPFLLAMCYWIDYETHGRRRDYLLALGLFLIAMLCKISMALFPLVILLYAWWKRDRIGPRDLKGAAPFLLISIVLGWTSIRAGAVFQHAVGQASRPEFIGGFLSHLALANTSIAFYFAKFLWPFAPLPIYPKWTVNPPSLLQFLPGLVLIGVMIWLWSRRQGWGRHVLLGLGFFLINLIPFVGFNFVTYMEFTWVMDHLLYLPMIGLLGLLVAAVEQMDDRLSRATHPLLAGVLAMAVALMVWESHWYAGMFINQGTLWTYTLERNPSAWLAHNNLGNVLFETGRIPEAIGQYQQALRFNPNSAEAHNNLGLALSMTGDTSGAMQNFEAALHINSYFAVAHANLGNVLLQTGRISEAVTQYQQALKIDPTNADAKSNLAKLSHSP